MNSLSFELSKETDFFEFKERFEEMKLRPIDTQVPVVRSYENVPNWGLGCAMLLLPLGVPFQLIIVYYERFEMDSMKRDLSNQIISAFTLWSVLSSIVIWTRCLLTLLDTDNSSGFVIFLEYLRLSCVIAWLLYPIQMQFFNYFSKVVLLRVPGYNHDFLAIWLHLTNLVISFYLECIQFIGKNGLYSTNSYPRIPLFIAGILTIQS